MIGIIIIIVVIIFGVKLYTDKQRRLKNFQLPPNTRRLLSDNVAFYENLDDQKKVVFESRIKDFLQHVSITGIGTMVEDPSLYDHLNATENLINSCIIWGIKK